MHLYQLLFGFKLSSRQLKTVPGTLLVKFIEVASPEQIVWVDGLAVATGTGFTVTVAVIDGPVQFTVEGVMVYTAVPGELPVATIV